MGEDLAELETLETAIASETEQIAELEKRTQVLRKEMTSGRGRFFMWEGFIGFVLGLLIMRELVKALVVEGLRL